MNELIAVARMRLTEKPPKRCVASLEGVERALARHRRRRRILYEATGGVLGLLAALSVVISSDGPEALRFEVHDGKSRTWEHTPDAAAGAVLEFSDGTVLALGARARARIAALSSRGAELTLERGSARLNVANRPDARWSIRAGTQQIGVLGAAFDADDRRQGLTLDLSTGSVSASGREPAEESAEADGQRPLRASPPPLVHE